MKIRQIKPDDWMEFKRIRLEALEESPFAFGRTYEEEAAYSDPAWEARVKWYVGDIDTYFLLGFQGLTAGAMAGCFRNHKKQGVSQLYGVWVKPEFRGTKTAEEMVTVLGYWSMANKMNQMEGYVAENNLRARAFYRKMGFEETDERIDVIYELSAKEILIRKELESLLKKPLI